MNEIRKEKLRILNLVDQINEKKIAKLALDFGSPGATPVSIYQYGPSGKITAHWTAHGVTDGGLLVDLKKVSCELRKMYREALVGRQEAVA